MELNLFSKKPEGPRKRGGYQICPQCGERVNSTTVKCPSCGWIFDETEANKSVKELSKQLSSWKCGIIVEEDKIIQRFPIPNTKSDLLELLAFLKPQTKKSPAFAHKYEECLIKAKTYYSSDPDFSSYISELRMKETGRKVLFIGSIVGALLLIIVAIWGCYYAYSSYNSTENRERRSSVEVQTDLTSCAKRITNAIESGELDLAVKTYSDFQGNKIELFSSRLKLIEALAENDQVDKAIRVFDIWHADRHHSYERGFENTSKCANIIYSALLSSNRYDDAERFRNWEAFESDYEAYYAYMEDCIKMMAKDKKYKEAHQFIQRHSGWFEKNVDSDWSAYKQYSESAVTKSLNKVIESYK